VSNQMNTPIRIKNFLLLQRFANQHHRNPQKTEFILVRQSTSSLKSSISQSLSNQMNTPIRIKNFLLLQRFANQHHRNPKKTEFILPLLFFLFLFFCLFSLLQKKRKKCTWALKKFKNSKNLAKFPNRNLGSPYLSPRRSSCASRL
jgi:hypothetical protein